MPERRVHDYRKPYWGHNTIITPDPDPTTASVTGWGDGVRQHDLLLLPNGESACFYVIETIRRPGNPPDMWTAHCRWVHAESRLGLKATLALDKQAVFAPSGLTSWRVFND